MIEDVALGLRANWRQFTLLVVINAFVGAMVGLERTIVPLIAEADFGLVSKSVVLSFILSFGLVKALTNLFAGRLSDQWGRKRILVAGWLFALPVPLLIIFAPSWGWIIFANVLLGINQGLCWSTTVIMKIDLVGSRQRGLAMGFNESAGYMAVSLSALASGYLASRFDLRPIPFYPGFAFAFLGLFLSAFFAQETHAHARHESALAAAEKDNRYNHEPRSFADVFLLTSWKDRAMFAVSQAGLVNNLNDGVVWGLVPLFLAAAKLPLEQIGWIVAAYPGVWSLCQLFTGMLSDRWGRKWMIAAGMGIQAIGIWLFVIGKDFWVWLAGSTLLGIGTAFVYPTLLAAISDVAHPNWRASAVGVYRLWRDGGYVVGAIVAGSLADAINLSTALTVVAALTFFSGIIVAAVMYETLHLDQIPASTQTT